MNYSISSIGHCLCSNSYNDVWDDATLFICSGIIRNDSIKEIFPIKNTAFLWPVTEF